MVCELHFQECDFIKGMVHKNMDTREITKAKYKKYRLLEKNDVLSVFLNYPQYLTKQFTSRSIKYPETRAIENEMHHVAGAIKESLDLAKKKQKKKMK